MSKRQIRAERRAAQERDHSWTEERDQDQQSEERPDDEYQGLDDFARMARELRQ